MEMNRKLEKFQELLKLQEKVRKGLVNKENGHYTNVANSLYTFSSTPFLHDENFAGRCKSTGFLLLTILYKMLKL